MLIDDFSLKGAQVADPLANDVWAEFVQFPGESIHVGWQRFDLDLHGVGFNVPNVNAKARIPRSQTSDYFISAQAVADSICRSLAKYVELIFSWRNRDLRAFDTWVVGIARRANEGSVSGLQPLADRLQHAFCFLLRHQGGVATLTPFPAEVVCPEISDFRTGDLSQKRRLRIAWRSSGIDA